jgi:formate dehydrogenase iron-sulfur subunit
LQRGPLSRAALVRDGLALVSIVLLAIAPGWIALLTLSAGELAERYLFFRAVDAPKMPGVAA